MSDAEELARKERRRRLIERLNEKEKLIGSQSQARPDERGGVSSRDRASEDAERCQGKWWLALASYHPHIPNLLESGATLSP